MNEEIEKLFFKSAVSAIINEENILNCLFDECGNSYDSICPKGINYLFETTHVYIIIKQLLKDKFPLLISWEHPYPNNNSEKADLAILKNDNNIDSFVEFKIWNTEDGSEIINDINKYKCLDDKICKYLFVLEYNGGDICDNINFLTNELKLKVICNSSIFTNYFDNISKTNIQVPLNIYFSKCNF